MLKKKLMKIRIKKCQDVIINMFLKSYLLTHMELESNVINAKELGILILTISYTTVHYANMTFAKIVCKRLRLKLRKVNLLKFFISSPKNHVIQFPR